MEILKERTSPSFRGANAVIALRCMSVGNWSGKCPSMKEVTLNQRGQARVQVLNTVLEYQLHRAQAAEVLGTSERQGSPDLAAYRREGAAALVRGMVRYTVVPARGMR